MTVAFSHTLPTTTISGPPLLHSNSFTKSICRPGPSPVNYSIPSSTRVSPETTTCVWVERSATVTIDGLNSMDCFDCYSDLEAMPKWSPWLKSVQVDKVDPDVSRWTLNARGLEVAWKARNTKVVRGEIIAWKSESGLSNRGRVEFEDMSDTRGKCLLTLAIEFDVPEVVASAIDNDYVGKFVEDTLGADLKRFRSVALRYRRQLSLKERRQSSPSSSPPPSSM